MYFEEMVVDYCNVRLVDDCEVVVVDYCDSDAGRLL